MRSTRTTGRWPSAYTAFIRSRQVKPARQFSWNIGLQRALTRNGQRRPYLGNRIVNVPLIEEQNPANLGFGPCTLYDPTSPGPRDYPVCGGVNVNQRQALNQSRQPAHSNTTRTALGYLAIPTGVFALQRDAALDEVRRDAI